MTKRFCDLCGAELKKPRNQFNPFLIYLCKSEDVCDECEEAFKVWAEERKAKASHTCEAHEGVSND